MYKKPMADSEHVLGGRQACLDQDRTAGPPGNTGSHQASGRLQVVEPGGEGKQEGPGDPEAR